MPIPDDPIGRSAIRKANLRLIPLIGLGYGAAYMDRVNISFASLQMNHDLGFSPLVYGTGAGLFFVSYALCEIPANLALVKFGARRWLARIMVTWGLLAMGMLFVRTIPQFYVMRFLLGMAEAGFFPGVVFYLTQWFPPEHRARAISRFYIALPLATTVMGTIASSLLRMNGRLGLRGWQWLFLVEGIPPVLLSLLFLKQLPDKPADAKWLTEPEQQWLEARLAAAEERSGPGSSLWTDLGQTLRDRRILLISLFFLCQLTILYAWSFSAPAILIQLTAVSVSTAGNILAVIGLFGAAAMLLTAYSSDRSGERTWHVMIPFLIIAAGYLVGSLTHHPYFAILCFAATVVAYNAAQGPVLSLPSTFLSGRSSAIGYAFANAVGMAGGFLGPWWMGWARELTGDYQRGLLTLTIPSMLAVGFIYLLSRMSRARTG